MTAKLSQSDILDLLAAAPARPADRCAYLALIGQHAQRQALDPDGSLLALAYRAAGPQVRGRLRAVLATEADPELVRVVVTGDQRDRTARMSADELHYLGRQLAEHRRWGELRRLTRDLPLAGAITFAGLLPAAERTRDGAVDPVLTALAECSVEHLGALLDRLPRQELITHRLGSMRVSFSADQAELAVSTTQVPPVSMLPRIVTETLRLSTGEALPRLREQGRDRTLPHVLAVIHLGGEILRMESPLAYPADAVRRLHPEQAAFPQEGPRIVSELRQASTGAVAVTRSGLVFLDRGRNERRHESVPRIAEEVEQDQQRAPRFYQCGIATLPESGLVAVATEHRILVLAEDGGVLLDEPDEGGTLSLSLLTPERLALIPRNPHEPRYIRLTFPAGGRARRDFGEPMGLAAFRELCGAPLDPGFAFVLAVREQYRKDALSDPVRPRWLTNEGGDVRRGRSVLAVSRYGDMVAASRYGGRLPITTYEGNRRVSHWGTLEVHSPWLPSVHELLTAPLLSATPHTWRRGQDLLAHVGDPEARAALALQSARLEDRFGGDIALGAPGAAPVVGPHDIALGDPGTQ